MRNIRVTVAVLALLSPAPTTLSAQAASSAPIRLVVAASNPSITAGEAVKVTVELRGLQNQPARAAKDYWIYLEAQDQGKAFWMHSVPIKAGTDASAPISISLDRVGVFMIKASHRELREGAIWINVRRKTSHATQRIASGLYGLLAVAWHAPRPEDASDEVVEFAIRSTGDGSKLYADGHEAALVQAFVTAGHPRSDIVLKFLPSLGVLEPNPLVIHPSDGQAQGRLTSNQRGSAILAPVKIDSDDSVRMKDEEWTKPVQFLRPIRTAHVRPEHNQRSLTDPAEDVWIELLGFDDDRPVVPDEDVHVTLEVNAKGDVSTSDVTLTARSPQQKVEFTPRKRGRATIIATPFGAAPSDAGTVDVVVPWEALLSLVIGGFAGGLLALYGKKFKGYRPMALRGLVGILVALVSYWLLGLSPVSAATVGNTLVAGFASLFTGFLGTKVLNLAWDVFSERIRAAVPRIKAAT